MKKVKYINENGRSMIEMLGVLAIIGVLSVGGIAGYSKAMMRYRVNKTIDNVSQISQNIRTFFTNQQSYNVSSYIRSAGRTIVEKAKLVPDEMIDKDQVLFLDAWGNASIGLYSWHFGTSHKKGFEIDMDNLSDETCIELAVQDWGSVASGLAYVAITNGQGDTDLLGSGTYPDVGCAGAELNKTILGCVGGTTIGLPFTLDVATKACVYGNKNEIMLIFQ